LSNFNLKEMMSGMRIAFLNSSIDEFGGIEQRIIELGERLTKKGHEVFYYSWYYDGDSADARYKKHVVKQMRMGFLARSLVHIFHKRIGNLSPNVVGLPISTFPNVLLITMAIADLHPDFIYLPAGYALAGLVTKISRTGLICYFVIEGFSTDSMLAKFLRPFERYTAINSICLSNSEYLASIVKRKLGVSRVTPIYGGAGWPTPPTKIDDRRTLLYFARFSPEKFEAHNFLLTVLKLLSHSNAKLILAGGLRKGLESYMLKLQNRINELGLAERVEVITNVPADQVPMLYARATLYIDPNVYDYSISIVEALEAGVPAVVRVEGGQAEPVIHGETGLRLGSDPQEWAEHIDRLLGSSTLISVMSSKAKVRATNFNWNKAAETLESEMLQKSEKAHYHICRQPP
jgi:glycosyltransferase involved in cell wall biosynthesis